MPCCEAIAYTLPRMAIPSRNVHVVLRMAVQWERPRGRPPRPACRQVARPTQWDRGDV